MEVFCPQNVYVDLRRVGIDLEIWRGCLAGIWSVRWQIFLRPLNMYLLRNMRHFGDGKLPQDVPSRRTTAIILIISIKIPTNKMQINPHKTEANNYFCIHFEIMQITKETLCPYKAKNSALNIDLFARPGILTTLLLQLMKGTSPGAKYKHSNYMPIKVSNIYDELLFTLMRSNINYKVGYSQPA